MTIEADPRHPEMLVDSTGVKDERPLTTNGSKDDPDIAFSVKELARRMSEPTTLDVERVRRLVRYLKFRQRALAWYIPRVPRVSAGVH